MLLGVLERAVNDDDFDLVTLLRELDSVIDQVEEDLAVALPVRADVRWDNVFYLKRHLQLVLSRPSLERLDEVLKELVEVLVETLEL